MNSEIIINVTSHESRVALLEDKKLVEFFVERPYDKRIFGNIYKGRVNKIIHTLQAAFIDIGLDKNAFLHVSDMEVFSEIEGITQEENNSESRKSLRKRVHLPIGDLIREGQEILVQVIKEPIGTKGPRVSTDINIPGRFLVLLLGSTKIAISRKISDRNERNRLKQVILEEKKEDVGVIIRTVSNGKESSYLKQDLKTLMSIYYDVLKKYKELKAPALIYKEISLLSSVIRDLLTPDVASVIVDDKKKYNAIVKYLDELKSDLKERIYYYRGEIPVFDNYEIEVEVNKIIDRIVWLRKGAYIIIEHTEALVSIDVNSGKNVKGKNFEDFILSVNIDAAIEIARQLRLRDIGGLIIVDFIDMESRINQQKVLNELKGAMKPDRAKYYILDFSEFGLVEITRQRVRPSILFTYSITCPICNGLGRIDSPLTIVSKIEHWFQRAKMWLEDYKFVVVVHKVVYDFILNEDYKKFKEIEKRNKVKLILEQDNEIDRYEFKIIDYRTRKDITGKFTNYY